MTKPPKALGPISTFGEALRETPSLYFRPVALLGGAFFRAVASHVRELLGYDLLRPRGAERTFATRRHMLGSLLQNLEEAKEEFHFVGIGIENVAAHHELHRLRAVLRRKQVEGVVVNVLTDDPRAQEASPFMAAAQDVGLVSIQRVAELPFRGWLVDSKLAVAFTAERRVPRPVPELWGGPGWMRQWSYVEWRGRSAVTRVLDMLARAIQDTRRGTVLEFPRVVEIAHEPTDDVVPLSDEEADIRDNVARAFAVEGSRPAAEVLGAFAAAVIFGDLGKHSRRYAIVECVRDLTAQAALPSYERSKVWLDAKRQELEGLLGDDAEEMRWKEQLSAEIESLPTGLLAYPRLGLWRDP